MKHYVMAFFILFSALSSQWVGAMAPQASHKHSPSHQTTMLKMDKASDQQKASHDCCPSEKKMTQAAEVISSNCPSCLDDCQCDNGVCHSNFSVGTLSSNTFSLQPLTEASLVSLQSHLPMAPVSLEIRPPKSA